MSTHASVHYENPDKLFKKFVILSLAVHLSFILAGSLKMLFFPSEPMILDQAIRVDIVALPDKYLPDQMPQKPEDQKASPEEAPSAKPPVEAKPLAKPEPKKIPKLDAKKEKQKQKKLDAAVNKLKEMEEREAAKAELQKMERISQAKAALIKGNEVSPGSALRGTQKSQFDDYIGVIHNQVHKSWDLPKFLQNDSLKATAIIFVDNQGNVFKRSIEKSSGDPRFDSYVLRAIDAASPLPKPPEKFADLVRYKGIVLGFPD